MKMRTIKLTPEALIDALRGKASPSLSSLPSDAEVLDIKYDAFSHEVLAVVRSDTFEDVAETLPIPELNVKTSAVEKAAPQPVVVAKPAPPPMAKTQLPPTQAPTAMDTSMTEEEFTPDQRKLLNFKVEGEFVIVKPIQFLKAEWEDINDVVRSLGGRWVKGDIISYWEVPVHQG
jgi:hypothetical protein